MLDVHGAKYKGYSRVVGYLRPVQGWNKGKKRNLPCAKNVNRAAAYADILLTLCLHVVALVSFPAFAVLRRENAKKLIFGA